MNRFDRIRAAVSRDWYRITSQGTSAEVSIFDEISPWGITADEFVRDLKALDVDTIELRLNTPGGLVFDGITIYNALRDHRATVNATVDGVAASIGSIIAMAGDTITMNRGTHMMIHDPSGGVIGNAKDMRDMADVLDKVAGTMAGLYADRAGGTPAEWRDVMLAETWYTADEAVSAGLADQVAGADSSAAAARWNLSDFNFRGPRAPAATANRSRLTLARHRARTHLEGVK